MKSSFSPYRKRLPLAMTAAIAVVLGLSTGLARAEYGLGSVFGNGGNKFAAGTSSDAITTPGGDSSSGAAASPVV